MADLAHRFLRDERLPRAKDDNEAIELERLHRNLLSSQPLCFNVFGQLSAYRPSTARLLAELLGLDVLSVTDVLVEHAPAAAKNVLRDRTAFDAYLQLETSDGPVFLAVETKYTEPFSQVQYGSAAYPRPTYGPVCNAADGWLKPGAAVELVNAATNQLWRMTMLAQLTEQKLGRRGLVIVLACDGDHGAESAIKGVRPWLKDGDKVRSVTFEQLLAAANKIPDLAPWTMLFRTRYLPGG